MERLGPENGPGVGASGGMRLRKQLTDHGLTEGEVEVALLVTEGISNQHIAARCCFTLNTVKSYLSRVYAKLGVENRVQLVLHLTALSAVVEGVSSVLP